MRRVRAGLACWPSVPARRRQQDSPLQDDPDPVLDHCSTHGHVVNAEDLCGFGGLAASFAQRGHDRFGAEIVPLHRVTVTEQPRASVNTSWLGHVNTMDEMSFAPVL